MRGALALLLGIESTPDYPDRMSSEPHSLAIKQFLAMVRFGHRAKLAELLEDTGRYPKLN